MLDLLQQSGFSFDSVTIADSFARHDNLWVAEPRESRHVR